MSENKQIRFGFSNEQLCDKMWGNNNKTKQNIRSNRKLKHSQKPDQRASGKVTKISITVSKLHD